MGTVTLYGPPPAMIPAAYDDRGFINVKVEKPWVSISADKRFIYITLKIC